MFAKPRSSKRPYCPCPQDDYRQLPATTGTSGVDPQIYGKYDLRH